MPIDRDATSGKYRPLDASQFTALLTGTGIANPFTLLLLQEAAGNPADSIGGLVYTIGGSGVVYQQAVAGEAKKGIKLTIFNSDKIISTDALLPDLATTSFLIFAWIYFPPYTGSNWAGARSVITGGPTFNQQIYLQHGDAGAQAIYKGAVGGSAAGPFTHDPADNVHGVLVGYNKATNKGTWDVVHNSGTESIEQVMSSGTITGKGLILGGDNGNENWAGNDVFMYLAAWKGAAAELSGADRLVLLNAFYNGPGVSVVSVDVDPPADTIVVGHTDNLVAIATYSDTTTADVTATAAWTTADAGVATVAAGVVTGVAIGGPVHITATKDGFSDFSAVTIASLTELDVFGPNRTYVGKTIALSVVEFLSDGTNVDRTATATWDTSDHAIATIVAGVLTGVARGVVNVTAIVIGVTVNFSVTVDGKPDAPGSIPGSPSTAGIGFF